jgi:uncharacterized protein (TIGR02145 family)
MEGRGKETNGAKRQVEERQRLKDETEEVRKKVSEKPFLRIPKRKIPITIASIVIVLFLVIWLAKSCENEKVTTDPVLQPESQIDSRDNKAWSDAVTTNTVAGYQAYLQDFKDGIHAEEAQKSIDEIEDNDDWQTALTNNTKAAYHEYLQNRPNGKWTSDANKKIDEFEQLAQQKQENARANKARLAEDKDWNTAKSTNTLESYQNYQNKYPDGRYKSEAANQIASILDATKKSRFRDPRDSIIYKTIRIGDQIWMAENLKATKFNDGTTINLVENNKAWANLSTPAYYWYDNNEKLGRSTYGALYNWYTVNTGKLCPVGWHVPTDEEWERLISSLGGKGIAGGKLKKTGTSHWRSPNWGATNESGFSALPGGDRYANGRFWGIGVGGYWWSASESDSSNALSRYVLFDSSSVYGDDASKGLGFSVRCVKD